MKLIIGLGNPGKQYQNNRHNVGFMVLDRILAKITQDQSFIFSSRWRKRVGAIVFQFHSSREECLLALPQKFINNSGLVLVDLMKYYNAQSSDILVIADDLNLDFGKIRFRLSGSDGGHNGLKSIIKEIGDQFARLRIGIKNQTLKDVSAWEDFVLSDFSGEERAKLLADILDLATAIVLEFIEHGHLKEQTYTVNSYG